MSDRQTTAAVATNTNKHKQTQTTQTTQTNEVQLWRAGFSSYNGGVVAALCSQALKC